MVVAAVPVSLLGHSQRPDQAKSIELLVAGYLWPCSLNGARQESGKGHLVLEQGEGKRLEWYSPGRECAFGALRYIRFFRTRFPRRTGGRHEARQSGDPDLEQAQSAGKTTGRSRD